MPPAGPQASGWTARSTRAGRSRAGQGAGHQVAAGQASPADRAVPVGAAFEAAGAMVTGSGRSRPAGHAHQEVGEFTRVAAITTEDRKQISAIRQPGSRAIPLLRVSFPQRVRFPLECR
jgi:hypothetical protein